MNPIKIQIASNQLSRSVFGTIASHTFRNSALVLMSLLTFTAHAQQGVTSYWSFEGTGDFPSASTGYNWSAVSGWGGNTITELATFTWDAGSPQTFYHAAGTGKAPYRYTSTTSRIAGLHSAMVLSAGTGMPTSGFILPGAPGGTASPRHDIKDDHHDRAQWSSNTGTLMAPNAVYHVAFSMKIAGGDTFDGPHYGGPAGPWCLFAQIHPVGGAPVFNLQPGTLSGDSTTTTTKLMGSAEQTSPTSRTSLKRSALRNKTDTADMIFTRNGWYDFVWKMKFGSSGFVEVWVKNKTDAQGTQWKAWSYYGPVMFTGSNPTYEFLVDVYRGIVGSSSGTVLMNRPKSYTVHFDEVRMADSTANITTLMPPP